MQNDDRKSRSDAADVKDPFLSPQRPSYDKGGAALGISASSPPKSTARTSAPSGTLGSAAVEESGIQARAMPRRRADVGKNSGFGSLVVVGTGIMAVNHVTIETQGWIKNADKVLCLGVDPVTVHWIRKLNEHVESLDSLRDDASSALQMQDAIAKVTLEHLRAGLSVCAVCGDSPIFSQAFRPVINKSHAGGYPAVMTASVSLEDCLFADLGIEPAQVGCQIFDATKFIVQGRKPDLASALILKLVCFVGQTTPVPDASHLGCPAIVPEVLSAFYGAEHEVTLYEPARYPICNSSIRRYCIGQLADASFTPTSVLYVPPKESVEPNPEVLRRLGFAARQ